MAVTIIVSILVFVFRFKENFDQHPMIDVFGNEPDGFEEMWANQMYGGPIFDPIRRSDQVSVPNNLRI